MSIDGDDVMSHLGEGGSDIESTAAPILDFLKNEARLLHKQAKAGSRAAIGRLNKNSPAVALGEDIQRKHCLATVAREIGFSGWKAVVECFEAREGADFAGFLHPRRCHIFWNIWLASYEAATKVRAEHGGFLLTYANQFIVVDDDYVSALGVGPDNALWQAIGRDWAKPNDFAARDQLSLLVVTEHMSALRLQMVDAVS